MISTRTLYLGSGQILRIQEVSAESITLEPTAGVSFQKCTIKTKGGCFSFPAQSITNNSAEPMQLLIVDGDLKLVPLEAEFTGLTGGAEDFTPDI